MIQAKKDFHSIVGPEIALMLRHVAYKPAIKYKLITLLLP